MANDTRFPNPYIGLETFKEEHAPFFYGREELSEIIASNLRASRLTVIYGPSGVGKSSLLQAGVVYQLNQLARSNLSRFDAPELAVTYFNRWHDDCLGQFETAVRESIIRALGQPALNLQDGNSSLADLLMKWATDVLQGRLLIVLDQFEEYLRYSPGHIGRDEFAREFVRLVHSPNARVNFLISIRDDAYTRLEYFRGEIFNLFDSSIPVRRLTPDEAKKAIKAPVDAYNRIYSSRTKPVEIKDDLVDKVLNEICGRSTPWDERENRRVGKNHNDDLSSQTVEAPFLQLVMERLWEVGSESGILSRETLDGLAEGGLKGTDRIVRDHFDSAIAALSANEQSIADKIFDNLITPSGYKIAYPVSELTKAERVNADEMGATVQKLDRARILRAVGASEREKGEAHFYEIYHDVLREPIQNWQRQRLEVQKRLAEVAEEKRRTQEQRERADKEAEEAKKQRRVAIGFLALSLVTAAFLVFALLQWRDAVLERKRADEQTDNANRAKQEVVEAKSDSAAAAAFNIRLQRLLYEPLSLQDIESLMTQPLQADLQLYREKGDRIAEGLVQGNLAGIYRVMSEKPEAQGAGTRASTYLKQAKSSGVQALDILKEYLDKDDPYLAAARNDLAVTFYSLGRFGKAERLLEQANATIGQAPGPGAYFLIPITENLGRVYITAAKYKKAETAFREARYLRRKVYGKGDQVARGLANLATVYYQKGEYDTAEYNTAETLLTRALDSARSPEVKDSVRFQLAGLYLKQGKLDQAATTFNEVTDRETVDAKSRRAAYYAGFLGNFYSDAGRYNEAEQFLKEALMTLGKRGTVPDKVNCASIQVDLANVYIQQNKFRNAEPLIKEALSAQQHYLGDGHPYIAKTLDTYALLLDRTGKGTEASQLRDTAKQILARHAEQERRN